MLVLLFHLKYYLSFHYKRQTFITWHYNRDHFWLKSSCFHIWLFSKFSALKFAIRMFIREFLIVIYLLCIFAHEKIIWGLHFYNPIETSICVKMSSSCPDQQLNHSVGIIYEHYFSEYFHFIRGFFLILRKLQLKRGLKFEQYST